MKRAINVERLAFVEALLLTNLQEFLAIHNGARKNLHICRGLVPEVPGCADLVPGIRASFDRMRVEIRSLIDGLRLVRAAMLARKVHTEYSPTQEAAELALRMLNATARGFRPRADVARREESFPNGVAVTFYLPPFAFDVTAPDVSPRMAQAQLTLRGTK